MTTRVPAPSSETKSQKATPRVVSRKDVAGISIKDLPTARYIIDQIKRNAATKSEMAKTSGISLRTIERIYRKLKKLGILIRTGSSRRPNWQIDDTKLSILETSYLQ